MTPTAPRPPLPAADPAELVALRAEVLRLRADNAALQDRLDGTRVDLQHAVKEEMTANGTVDRLRAIIEGRTTPPTDAEIKAHDAAGGSWLVRRRRQNGLWSAEFIGPSVWCCRVYDGGVYVALDSERRPCPWPRVTP